MGHNLFIEEDGLGDLEILIYAESPSIAALMIKCLVMVGCKNVNVSGSCEEASRLIKKSIPELVIVLADPESVKSWDTAIKLNKTRANNNKRTPKILGLIKPTSVHLSKAKKAGFYDILPLPQSPNTLANRILTVVSRLD